MIREATTLKMYLCTFQKLSPLMFRIYMRGKSEGTLTLSKANLKSINYSCMSVSSSGSQLCVFPNVTCYNFDFGIFSGLSCFAFSLLEIHGLLCTCLMSHICILFSPDSIGLLCVISWHDVDSLIRQLDCGITCKNTLMMQTVQLIFYSYWNLFAYLIKFNHCLFNLHSLMMILITHSS